MCLRFDYRPQRCLRVVQIHHNRFSITVILTAVGSAFDAEPSEDGYFSHPVHRDCDEVGCCANVILMEASEYPVLSMLSQCHLILAT